MAASAGLARGLSCTAPGARHAFHSARDGGCGGWGVFGGGPAAVLGPWNVGLEHTPSADEPSGISTMRATTVLNSTAAALAASCTASCCLGGRAARGSRDAHFVCCVPLTLVGESWGLVRTPL